MAMKFTQRRPTSWDELPLAMTTSEVAVIFNTDSRAITRYIRLGKIKATGGLGKYTIDKDEVRRCLKNGFRTPETEECKK